MSQENDPTGRPNRRLRKSLIQSAVLACVGLAFLVLLIRLEWIDVSMLAKAVENNAHWILLSGLAQVVGLTFALFRYRSLLRANGVEVKLPAVTNATAVGTALGQWLPGAMTLIEALRIGLMFGAHNVQNLSQQAESPDSAAKSPSAPSRIEVVGKLALVGFLDRLVGLSVFLATGGLILAFLSTTPIEHMTTAATWEDQMTPSSSWNTQQLLLGISLVSLFASLSLMLIPGVATSKKVLALMQRVRDWSARHNSRMVQRVLGAAMALALSMTQSRIRYRSLLLPLLLSLFSNLCFVLNYKFCALALGADIHVLHIAGVIPFIGLASLLPLGFGGIGGYQLVAVALFQPFGVDPTSIASTSLLQGTVVLLTQSLVGLFFLRSSLPQVRAILQRG